MEDQILIPGPQLLESMRAVGYSLKTALADIIDNSLAADAQKIEILFLGEGPTPHLVVLDDGNGMNFETALDAMRLAGNSVRQPRSRRDLGRFGLGLKTASLSQCRRLTILSKQGESLIGLCWDLDHIAMTQEWALQKLSNEECRDVPRAVELLNLKSGTLVVWENLDVLSGQGTSLSRALDSRMVEVRDHLALVFHQFLSGYAGRAKVEIRVNYVPIEAADPFLRNDPRTQVSPVEELVMDGGTIFFQAFTLPVVSKLTASQRAKAQIAGSLRDSQGFYIYRGGRLVIWGTWFRLAPKTELGKLARVKVDVPNSLDSLWEIDIKKSQATPPDIVKNRLRSLVGTLVAPSERAHTFRGRKPKAEDPVVRLWELVEDRDAFRYELNRDHPMVQGLGALIDVNAENVLDNLLTGIESSFPLQDAVNRISIDHVPMKPDGTDDEWLVALSRLWATYRTFGEDLTQFVDRMVRSEPFDQIQLSTEGIFDYLSDPEGVSLD